VHVFLRNCGLAEVQGGRWNGLRICSNESDKTTAMTELWSDVRQWWWQVIPSHEASVVQPSASVDRVDQWWDLSQSPVSARAPNLIGGDKTASVVAIEQIRLPMSARLSGVLAARSIEFHVDSDLEHVPPGWLQILPVYMKYSPVASESCAWSKSRPLDP
jgi:hypothetical protein